MSLEDQKLDKIFRDAREETGLTQAPLAKKGGFNANYYARVERGEVTPRVDIVEKIAKALNISLRFPL